MGRWGMGMNLGEDIKRNRLHLLLGRVGFGINILKHESEQTYSMPWGILSLPKRQFRQNLMIYDLLLSIAPDCPCCNVLYDFFFDEMI